MFNGCLSQPLDEFVNTDSGTRWSSASTEVYPAAASQPRKSVLTFLSTLRRKLCRMAKGNELDAYEKPPAFVKNIYKFYQRLPQTALDLDAGILDLSHDSDNGPRDAIAEVDTISQSTIRAACRHLQVREAMGTDISCEDVKIYESRGIPGNPSGESMRLRLLPHISQVCISYRL